MSDDLVKRLRQSWNVEKSIMSQTGLWMREREEAADRIEELEADRRKTYAALLKVTRIHDEVEAKLARAVPLAEVARLAGKLGRAVEGLHDIAKEFDGPRSGLTDFGEREHYKWMACKLRDKASAVLAELKGQTDE